MQPTRILPQIEREQEIRRISLMSTSERYFFLQDLEVMQTDMKREYRELYNIATGVVSVDVKQETDICFEDRTMLADSKTDKAINIDVQLLIKVLGSAGAICIILAAVYGMFLSVVAWMSLYGIYVFGGLVAVGAAYIFLFGGAASGATTTKQGDTHNHYYYQNNSFGGQNNKS